MNKTKMNFVEATFLILIVMLSHIILNLPNLIIKSTGSSSIINVLYISVLTILFFLVINKLFSPFPEKDIIDVSEFLGGKFLKLLTCVIYTIYLLFAASILIVDFSELLRIIYFQNAKTFLISLIFIIVAIIANKIGFKNIIKANTLLIPIVLVTVLFIFGASLKGNNYQRIFPIMGYGINQTFVSGISNVFSFAGLIILYLIKPSLKDGRQFKKIGLTAIIISASYLLFSVAALLFLFPFLTEGVETLSVYMSTRAIQFGSVFQRTDAIFILIWIFTFLSYLSVVMGYIAKINKKTFNLSNSSPLVYIVGLCMFIMSLLPADSVILKVLETVVYKNAVLIVVFCYSFIILLLGFLKKKKKPVISADLNE